MKTKKHLHFLIFILIPLLSMAQDSGTTEGLHQVLTDLYNDMLPLCSNLIGVGRGIAGFAALWYIANRVWRHLANGESIDFYPLLRPFAIGLVIMAFPAFVHLINGIMKPTVTATSAMVKNSNASIALLLQKREEALQQTDAWKYYIGPSGEGDQDRWYTYTHDNADPDEEGFWEGIGNDIKFSVSKMLYNSKFEVKRFLSELLQLIYQAAALCIDTLRTFQLIVLAIIGPLVFAIAVFDGFQHTLAIWIARYINVYLWLPIANILGALLGKIQEHMLQLDLSQIATYQDTTFSPYDVAYIIFLIIGIIGYFTIPSMANYIIHASGGNAHTQKVTNLLSLSSRKALAAAANTATAGTAMVADAMGDAYGHTSQNMADRGASKDYFDDQSYDRDQLQGEDHH
ncbi:conjugative transposon protein TraJ [Zhouia sp. PK063]|uniref:conjugative transposon protein TraJ n=1 Tax=Zhouia sp. PK063 TaxID=3373602 RepID=UPI00378D1995